MASELQFCLLIGQRNDLRALNGPYPSMPFPIAFLLEFHTWTIIWLICRGPDRKELRYMWLQEAIMKIFNLIATWLRLPKVHLNKFLDSLSITNIGTHKVLAEAKIAKFCTH